MEQVKNYKIRYEDLNKDKDDIILLFNKIIPIYSKLGLHTKLLELEQWYTMIIQGKDIFTPDAMLALNNIMIDCCNYLSTINEEFDYAYIALEYVNKITKLFKDNKEYE